MSDKCPTPVRGLRQSYSLHSLLEINIIKRKRRQSDPLAARKFDKPLRKTETRPTTKSYIPKRIKLEKLRPNIVHRRQKHVVANINIILATP